MRMMVEAINRCNQAEDALLTEAANVSEESEADMWEAFNAFAKAADAERMALHGYAQTYPHPRAFRRVGRKVR